MSRGRRLVGIVVWLWACGPSGSPDRLHDRPPEFVIALSLADANGIQVDSARRAPAPPVRFGATVRPDLDHLVLVRAPAAGTIVWVRSEGPTTGGDTLARYDDGRAIARQAPGRWWPRVTTVRPVAANEAIGALAPPGRVLAVGSVPRDAAAFLHTGDSAQVTVGTDGIVTAGVVERVRPTGEADWAPVSIAVEFTCEGRCEGDVVEVTVDPGGPRDSVIVAPAAAVWRLSSGTAVFERLSAVTYRVRWTRVGEPTDDQTPLLQLSTPMIVAVGDLAVAVRAAEDSLRRWARR